MKKTLPLQFLIATLYIFLFREFIFAHTYWGLGNFEIFIIQKYLKGV